MQKIGVSLRVKGKVQGVGFRPFVWQVAQQLAVNGRVYNDHEGVLIQLFAEKEKITEFIALLTENCPVLALIDEIIPSPFEWDNIPTSFTIAQSEQGQMNTQIVPDAVICPDCLLELLDEGNRRYHYPFINCTHCGPRFTIIKKMPYDRKNTTMADFPLCDECAKEYNDPTNRRFHAQPTACAVCGPKIWVVNPLTGKTFTDDQAFDALNSMLKHGKVIAIKGLGGFHLACDATQSLAVKTLRQRKERPTKPFAVMYPSLSLLEKEFPQVKEHAIKEQLTSAAAPIVLLKSSTKSSLSPLIAPNLSEIGVMLPTTPLHHLIVQKINTPLVMTSGNKNGYPPALTNEEAMDDLGRLADLIVLHDRDIAQRADDSVIRVNTHTNDIETFRRARGYVPDTLALPDGFKDSADILAVGGDRKNTFCLVKDHQLIVSQHLGDLHQPRVEAQWQHTLDFFCQVYNFTPKHIACDAHPTYQSTLLAKALAEQKNCTLTSLLHHHAHAAACLAENQWPLHAGPVIALTLDGLGYGPENQLWGGECLKVDYLSCQHLGGLPSVSLPGGDLAAEQPWRNLIAHLFNFVPQWQHYPESKAVLSKCWQPLIKAMERSIQSPRASSCGRLFDAIAAALNIAPSKQSWEGEAASHLETLASSALEYPHPIKIPLTHDTGKAVLNLNVFWEQWLSWKASPAQKAWAFHDALSEGFAYLASQMANQYGIKQIVLTGGVLHNRILRERLCYYLNNFTVMTPKRFPANDGGLALGQAVLLAAKLQPSPLPELERNEHVE